MHCKIYGNGRLGELPSKLHNITKMNDVIIYVLFAANQPKINQNKKYVLSNCRSH